MKFYGEILIFFLKNTVKLNISRIMALKSDILPKLPPKPTPPLNMPDGNLSNRHKNKNKKSKNTEVKSAKNDFIDHSLPNGV